MKERNPKDYFEARILQLKDSTPIVGKIRRKKAMEEICNSKFDGWHEEKMAAVLAGLNNEEKEISIIAENYLMSLDYNSPDKNLVLILCNTFIETPNQKVVSIIRKKKYMPKFDTVFKTIEFYASVYGPDVVQKTIDKLSIPECFSILNETNNNELKSLLLKKLREIITLNDLPELMSLFEKNPNYYFYEFIDKYFEELPFHTQVFFIQRLPGLKGVSGNRQAIINQFFDRLDKCIQKEPDSIDAQFAIDEYNKSPNNNWLLDLLTKNRSFLNLKNELALCNHFKEYEKVRTILNNFNTEDLCKFYTYFAGTPLECIFQQKLRLVIKKLNYSFNFNLIKEFFHVLDESMKQETFKILANFSLPAYMDFVLYQLDKISNYSTTEKKVYLQEIIPHYILMFFKLPQADQLNTINKLSNLDYATIDFLINRILKLQSTRIIPFLETLLQANKFSEAQELVIIEIVLNQQPDLINASELLTQQAQKYFAKVETVKKLIEELEKQCARKYTRDDKTGINEEIDRKRAILIQEIQKIDIEKNIEILLPHYSEKNYRLKKDVRKILETTKVGYRYLIPFALAPAMQDKDIRDFAVELLDKRIRPYVPFYPDINMNPDNYKYVEIFFSEQEALFKELARILKKCNLVVKRK